MRLHFQKTVEVEDVFDQLPHNKIGAVTLREKPDVEVLVDMYDDATQQQIQNVIDKAKTKGLVLTWKESGTFVVQG